MTIDINDLTLRQIREIASLAGSSPVASSAGLDDMVGKKVIIRTFSAGNFFGTLEKKNGDEIYLINARRMWYWKAAKGISLSACALYGINHETSKIVAPVERIWLQAIEIIPCTPEAVLSLEGAPHAQAG